MLHFTILALAKCVRAMSAIPLLTTELHAQSKAANQATRATPEDLAGGSIGLARVPALESHRVSTQNLRSASRKTRTGCEGGS
jgi:hypothetical protein